jgi:hypothetical protein
VLLETDFFSSNSLIAGDINIVTILPLVQDKKFHALPLKTLTPAKVKEGDKKTTEPQRLITGALEKAIELMITL